MLNPGYHRKLQLVAIDTLIDLVREGDKSAFCELLARSSGMTRRIAIAILHNEADVEDALQEASLRAFTKFHSFKGESTFSTWFTRIVINTCKIHLRRQRSKPTSSLDEMCEMSEMANLGSTTPEAEYVLTDLRRKARIAVLHLPQNLEVVARDVILEDQSLTDVAAKLGLTVSCTKSRLFRAKKILIQSFVPTTQARL